jgi:hypothetical protein
MRSMQIAVQPAFGRSVSGAAVWVQKAISLHRLFCLNAIRFNLALCPCFYAMCILVRTSFRAEPDRRAFFTVCL